MTTKKKKRTKPAAKRKRATRTRRATRGSTGIDLSGKGAVQAEPPGQKSRVGNEQQDLCIVARDTHHLAQCRGLVEKMLQGTHAGYQVESTIGKRQ